MFPTSPFGMLGVSLLIGAVSVGLRLWFFWAGSRAFRGPTSSAGDSYLSFDERLAEKLRELEREKASTPEPIAAPQSASPTADPTPPARPMAVRGFGRRGV